MKCKIYMYNILTVTQTFWVPLATNECRSTFYSLLLTWCVAYLIGQLNTLPELIK